MADSNFSMHDLHKVLTELKDGEVILDVRRPDEYAEGHIEGSINIPHEEVQSHVDDLKKYSRIYLHCRSGKRAQVARKALEDAGVKTVVCISNSGMLDWLESGYPVKS